MATCMEDSTTGKRMAELFELLRSLPEVWQTKNPKYTNHLLKDEAYQKLLVKYREMEPEANVDNLKKKIQSYRSCFRREFRKVKESMRSGIGAADVYKPLLWYYKHLEFLLEQEEEVKMEAIDSENIEAEQELQLIEQMSRKNNSRLSKKKIRKNMRKAKRSLENMQHAGKMSNGAFGTRISKVVEDGSNDYSRACSHYDIPEDSIRSWYDRIYHKLNEDTTKRVYHNWSCMLAPKRIELEKAKPHIVLAAFFQYYEFDLEKSCVQENCKIFKEFCQDGMVEDEDMKQLVCHLIGEKSTECINSNVEDDMAILQDLDLLILASTPDVYKNYAELSRQEWSTSGKTNFDLLRRKTLATLLALDIYQTPEFSNKYAKAARANIEQELKELEKC